MVTQKPVLLLLTAICQEIPGFSVILIPRARYTTWLASSQEVLGMMVLIAVRGRAMPLTLGSSAMLVLGRGEPLILGVVK